jgi:hypothetical protein
MQPGLRILIMQLKITGKRGVIEVGFAWIFILIAGAVILGLFSYIGVNQAGTFKNMMDAKLLTDLNTIFVGAMVSRDTAARFPIPKTQIRFDCNGYSIGDIKNTYEGRLVFAPESIDTRELITWSKSWSLGFRVANFLYITSPHIKYYIVFNSNLPGSTSMQNFAYKLSSDLPVQLEKEVVDLAKAGSENNFIKDENFDKIIILVLGEPQTFSLDFYNPDNFKRYGRNEISFLYAGAISQIGTDTFVAEISFRDKENSDNYIFWKDAQGNSVTSQSVIDISALYGAFISGSPETFNCVMNRAFIKSREVINFYIERTKLIDKAPCLMYYSSDQAGGEFNTMYQTLNQGSIDITRIKRHIILLDELNNLLERTSCPLLY